MAWNKPSEKKVAEKKKGGQRNVHLKGLIAGAIVVLGAGLAAWLIWPDAKPPLSASTSTSTSRIKEVTPAVAPTNAVAAAPKVKDPHEGYHLSTMGVWQPNGRPTPPGRKKVHGIFTNRVGRAKVVYSNVTEQVILQIFNRELGDAPMPLPAMLPQKDMDELVSILLDKHPESSGDSDSIKYDKETLRLAKKEMLKFVKEGGDPYDFLKSYHDQLTQAFNRRFETQNFVMDTIRNGEDPAVVNDLINRLNADLKRDGIRELDIPEEFYKTKEQIEAEEKAAKKED